MCHVCHVSRKTNGVGQKGNYARLKPTLMISTSLKSALLKCAMHIAAQLISLLGCLDASNGASSAKEPISESSCAVFACSSEVDIVRSSHVERGCVIAHGFN